ncbi:hypothetical protein BKA70DRAFT_1420033 [Coprinopsis sp. MPI-PUGE-AT-0042]|nr:hypothetical protein BKA70DRAFT_1420033 [Coprinopsis sp. MPI-PUGE-AT-0042]
MALSARPKSVLCILCILALRISDIDVDDGEQPGPSKKTRSRVAETRPCPICHEQIPLRLLGKHAALEAERVDIIISQIGSEQPFYDERDEPGPSAPRGRRSALKARQTWAPSNTQDPLHDVTKTIQGIKRRRKQRHAKIKEMVRDLEDDGSAFDRRDAWSRAADAGQIVCPICTQTVRGDQDVLDAHVDACVANESLKAEAARQEELALANEEEWESGSTDSGQYAGNIAGAGFHRRNPDHEDVDEDIDIDGDDQVVYGQSQFTEGDILPITQPTSDDPDLEINIEDDDEDACGEPEIPPRSNEPSRFDSESRSASAHPDENFAKLHLAIESAKQKGDKRALIAALQSKIKLLVRTALPLSQSQT